MINRELIAPESIVIIGGSNNTQNPEERLFGICWKENFPGNYMQ